MNRRPSSSTHVMPSGSSITAPMMGLSHERPDFGSGPVEAQFEEGVLRLVVADKGARPSPRSTPPEALKGTPLFSSPNGDDVISDP